jgi:UDP-N-acetylglucosamine transferase subunit ALG13
VILVTVGTDGPFDRLVLAVDAWAARSGRNDVYAQIGNSGVRPRHIRHEAFLDPAEFRRQFTQASVVVSHAGMGTILTALQYRKPLLVMPRRAALGEQRNDHQLATARYLLGLGRITVAADETELEAELARIDELTAREAVGPYAQPELIGAIRRYIHECQDPPAPHQSR